MYFRGNSEKGVYTLSPSMHTQWRGTHNGEIHGSLTKRLLNNVEYDYGGDQLIMVNLHTRMPYRS